MIVESDDADSSTKITSAFSLDWGPALALVAGAARTSRRQYYQGYVEGKFVYVASPQSGRLDSLCRLLAARQLQSAIRCSSLDRRTGSRG